MFNGRQEDLSKVFDRTWMANHNDVAKRGRDKEKKFMDKMFNTNRVQGDFSRLSIPGQRAENLHSNMNSAYEGYKKNNMNNIVKKWK